MGRGEPERENDKLEGKKGGEWLRNGGKTENG